MAVDDRRTPRDYIRNARSRYDTAGGSTWTAILIGLAVLAIVVYMIFSVAAPNRTGTYTQPTGTTTSAQTTQPK